MVSPESVSVYPLCSDSNRGSVSACCIQHFMETCETALDLGSSTEARAHTYTHIV